MNKYQEALDRIKTAPSFMGGTKEYRYSAQSSTPFLEDIAVLQELVDKETPMFVDQKTKGKFPNGDGSFHTTFRCPKCNCMLHLDWKEYRRYCPECGQKLNFGESEVNDS